MGTHLRPAPTSRDRVTDVIETALPKVYDPNEAETRWYQLWSDAGLFKPGSDTGTVAEDAPSYVIMMPPPMCDALQPMIAQSVALR